MSLPFLESKKYHDALMMKAILVSMKSQKIYIAKTTLRFRCSRKWTNKTVWSAGYQSSCWNRETTFICCLWWSGKSCSWRYSRNVSKWSQHGSFNYAIKTHPWLIQHHKQLTDVTRQMVTNIPTICDIMNSNPAAKSMCPEVHALLKLCHDCSSNHVNSRAVFSTMRWIKTYLRSIMTQERLNHSFILNPHRPWVAELDLNHIAKLFISANDHRCAYFGKM